MLKDTPKISGFVGSNDNYNEADVIIVGAPMDYTVSFRPGTRFGPNRIREVSYGLEFYSPYLDRSLKTKKYYDYGDLIFNFGNVTHSLEMIGKAAKEIFEDNKKPLFLGGEHLISSPIIKEAYNKYGKDLVILHFDAHTDLRDTFFGEANSHATVIKQTAAYVNPKNIYHFGIRSGEKEEFEWARQNSNMFIAEVVEPLRSVLPNIKNNPIYVTIDIDVVDPGFAPGTGTPEPGGCTPKEILEVIHMLKDFNVIGFDLVEVSPTVDTSDITSVLASKIIREAILSFL